MKKTIIATFAVSLSVLLASCNNEASENNEPKEKSENTDNTSNSDKRTKTTANKMNKKQSNKIPIQTMMDVISLLKTRMKQLMKTKVL